MVARLVEEHADMYGTDGGSAHVAENMNCFYSEHCDCNTVVL